jgi:8-oxo-dGTP pyrophosphatase MutT (NUDIX family)
MAAKREFLEETGMEASAWELYKKYPVGEKIDWDIYYYIARDCKKVSEPHLDPGERIDIKKVTFEDFLDLVTAEGFDSIGFANDLLRMRLEPEQLAIFKERLFSK